uniref:ThyX n=1 Tax=Geladintestivirus 2 TaxID=3233134 RepID=A0AAU8MJV8_9CAUD
MKIDFPEVSIWKQDNELIHIARCARVCYASEGNGLKLVNILWDNNHRSMFRHAGVYYIIPEKLVLPFEAYKDVMIILEEGKYYVSTNRQTANEWFDCKYKKYEIPIEEAKQNEVFVKYKMIRYTFCIQTGIDITRELNRKSPNNIAEQSTRYIDFNKKIGIIYKYCHWMKNLSLYKLILVNLICKVGELLYKISRSKYGLNLSPEDARWCLFLDTMSKVVYTYTVKDWEYIINLRLFDYTGKAHPDAKVVASSIKKNLEKEGYEIINIKDCQP